MKLFCHGLEAIFNVSDRKYDTCANLQKNKSIKINELKNQKYDTLLSFNM